VSGCHIGDCHYSTGNCYARRRFAILRDLLQFMGVEDDRVTFRGFSFGGNKWQEVGQRDHGPRPGVGAFHAPLQEKGGETL